MTAYPPRPSTTAAAVFGPFPADLGWAGDGQVPFRGAVADGDDATPAALRVDNLHLRARLATLPAIEQAKGILIAHYRIGAEAAFDLLRRWSSHANIKLRDIAHLLVETASQSPVPPSVDQDRLPADLVRFIDLLSDTSPPIGP